nr:MAG TPA: hypothetical protein [Caudoviricetes sp.]
MRFPAFLFLPGASVRNIARGQSVERRSPQGSPRGCLWVPALLLARR